MLVDFNSNTTKVDYYFVILIVRLQLRMRKASFFCFCSLNRPETEYSRIYTGPELVQYFS